VVRSSSSMLQLGQFAEGCYGYQQHFPPGRFPSGKMFQSTSQKYNRSKEKLKGYKKDFHEFNPLNIFFEPIAHGLASTSEVASASLDE
jgi:hypothetical protein